MSFPYRPTNRQNIETLEVRAASFLLEDGHSKTEQINFRLDAGQRVRLARDRRRWISPLVRALAGLVHPVDGSVTVNGTEISELSFEEFGPYRANIGFSFAQPALLHSRTIRENLQLPVFYHWEKSPTEVIRMVNVMAERLNIKDFLELQPAYVPNGVNKLVTVVRAFMREPQIVLLDDPFVSLEKRSQEILASWLSFVLERTPELTLMITSNESSFDSLLGLTPINSPSVLQVKEAA